MAQTIAEMKILFERRNCTFRDIDKCLFHGWYQRSKFLGGDQKPIGLIELPDGNMVEADPKEVRFCDENNVR